MTNFNKNYPTTQYRSNTRYGGGAEENEQNLEEEMLAKTMKLKHITISLGNEIKESNSLLNSLDKDFEHSGSFMNTTIGRVGKLAKSGGWKLYFILFLFSLFVFTVLYLVIKWF
jgi:blocked early in transport 1